MVRISKWIVAAGVLASGTAVVRDAHAQYWLQDRALTEGRGIRVGNFELHPGIGIEGGFDSNPTYVPSGHETPAGRLRITPSISIATLGPQRAPSNAASASALPVANFRAGAALIVSSYFGNNLPHGTSTGFGIGDSTTNVGGSVNLALELLPFRPFRVNIADSLSRTFQGQTDFGVSLYTFNRIQNLATIEAVIAPNSPNGTFDFRISYSNSLFYVENGDFARYRNMTNDVTLRSRWQFLPKTALTFDASFLPTTYFNPTASVGSSLLTNSYPVRTRFGLSGLLSEHFALTANVGFQGTYFDRGDNVETVIGQLEGRFITGPSSAIRFGFVRDVQPSFIGNYYVRNELYANVSQSFSGRFLLSGQLSGGYYQYGYASDLTTGTRSTSIVTPTDADGRFHSFRIAGNVFGEYRFTDWLGVNATLGISSNITNAQINTNPTGTANLQSLQWTRFEGLVGIRVSI